MHIKHGYNIPVYSAHRNVGVHDTWQSMIQFAALCFPGTGHMLPEPGTPPRTPGQTVHCTKAPSPGDKRADLQISAGHLTAEVKSTGTDKKALALVTDSKSHHQGVM